MTSPSPGRFRQADAILDAALDLPETERAGFVERACEGDAPLRALVQRLLRATTRDEGVLGAPALEFARPLIEAPTRRGERRTPLPSAIGPWTIDRELGRGGMGIVYLAISTTEPERQVAIKIVRGGGVVAGATLRRFLAERRILASLDHPCVARLIEAGITPAGAPWFAMDFCAGGSLTDQLAGGPLELGEALRIARQLADALAAAHDVGIVHRDVKPANVLFASDGRVQLTDFGVAKLVDQESTQSGALLGTPAYLAPEQLRGLPVDHRADLWALGVTIYQMLAGHRPFDGPSYASTLHAVLTADAPSLPPSLAAPPALHLLVHHLLEKEPAMRPESAADVARAISVIEADPAAPYALADRDGDTPTPSARARGVSIVVMPFANTSGNADDSPLTDGITDELIGALGKVRGLRVTARTTAFALRGKGLDARTITSMLGAAYLLEGSVRRVGDRLKVSVQLVRGADGGAVWSGQYDRAMGDVFHMQEELAHAITVAIAPTFGGDLAPEPAPRTRDIVTYELFLKARYHQQRRAFDDLRLAVDNYRAAVARDPAYGEAWAGLAESHVILTALFNQPPSVELPLARHAISQALDAAPDDPSVLAVYGNLLNAFEWRWRQAEDTLRRALAIDPGSVPARLHLAILLQHLGRIGEAVDFAHAALQLDPLSVGLNLTLGRAYMHGGDYAQAMRSLRTSLELGPRFGFAEQQLGYALLGLGQAEEALMAFRRARESGGPMEEGALIYALAVTGDLGAARARFEVLRAGSKEAYTPPFSLAIACAGLGDAEGAVGWLERARLEHAAGLNVLRVAPALASLRGYPPFEALLLRMGLDDASLAGTGV